MQVFNRRSIKKASSGSGRLPAEYQEVKWIQGNLAVDIFPTLKSTLLCQAKFTGEANGNKLFGDNYYDSDEWSYRLFGYANSWYFDYKDWWTWRICGGNFIDNRLYEVEFANRYVKDLVTGNIIIQDSEVEDAFEYETPYKINFNSDLRKFYYLKLYDGDSLVRDVVPCYRKSDTELGVYDLVNDQWYDAGTGTKGPNV